MVTINEIAQAAGVSPSTVSRVLNHPEMVSPETRQTIEALVREHDYRPSQCARGLVKGRRFLDEAPTLNIALLGHKPRGGTAADSFAYGLLQAIEIELGRAGYNLVYLNTQNPERASSLAIDRKADGVLVVDSTLQDIALSLAERIPVVAVDFSPIGNHIDAVVPDYEGGIYQGVRHLLSLGHKRIALLTCDWQMVGTFSYQQYYGYVKALSDAGLDADSQLVIEAPFDPEGGYCAGLDLLQRRDRPTAIVATDTAAVGVYRAARELGLSVPGDVSVLGIDDLEMCKFVDPPLSSVSANLPGLGSEAVQRLLWRIENPEAAALTLTIPTKLVIRDSCAAVPDDV